MHESLIEILWQIYSVNLNPTSSMLKQRVKSTILVLENIRTRLLSAFEDLEELIIIKADSRIILE
jgi:hypothetical protein